MCVFYAHVEMLQWVYRIFLKQKAPVFYPLTSNQVHIDEIWFNVSRLLWLVPQALQGETDAE